MNALATAPAIAPTPAHFLRRIRTVEDYTRTLPQIQAQTSHVLHGGLYARTITLPPDVVLTGVLVKIATTIIVNGDCAALVGDGQEILLRGYNVLPAAPGRKQVFRTYTEVNLTMVFPTTAQTVRQAENEFTDETDLLMSRAHDDCDSPATTRG